MKKRVSSLHSPEFREGDRGTRSLAVFEAHHPKLTALDALFVVIQYTQLLLPEPANPTNYLNPLYL